MKHEISVHLHTFPYLIEGWSLFRMPNPIGTAILGLQQEALKHTYECSLFPRLLTSGPTLIDWHFSASIGSAEAENTLTTLEIKRQTNVATMEIKLNLTVRLQGSFECSLQYSDCRKCFWGCSIRRWNKPLHGVCFEDTWRIALLRLADILQLQLICKNRRHFVKARKKAANIHSNEGKKLSLSRLLCRQPSRQLERLNEVSRRTFEEDEPQAKLNMCEGALWDIGFVLRNRYISLHRFTVFGACTYDMVIHKSEIYYIIYQIASVCVHDCRFILWVLVQCRPQADLLWTSQHIQGLEGSLSGSTESSRNARKESGLLHHFYSCTWIYSRTWTCGPELLKNNPPCKNPNGVGPTIL